MNAAIVNAFDVPPRYGSFDDPVAAEGERLVSVTAAGLHAVVKSLANGTHYGSTGELPFIPGVDGVGKLQDGTRVYFGVARKPFGTFSEHAPAAAWMCLPLPEGIDDATAAGIANPAMSSWVALTARAKFVGGESVLILGATGVAGQLAVQIAKRLGARRVVAAGRNPQALEQLLELGADATVSLDQARMRHWKSPPSGRNGLNPAWTSCSIISGGIPRKVRSKQFRKKASAMRRRAYDSFRSETARAVQFRCPPLRCAARAWNFWAAVSAVRRSNR